MDTMKSEEIKAIVAEIDEFNKRYSDPEEWQIHSVAHLYNLPVELYLVRYKDGYYQVMHRNEEGNIAPADTWTYWAPDYERKARPVEALQQE